MAIASTNPATGEKLKEFKAFNDAEIEKRLKRAEHAFQQHRRESFPKRAELLVSIATLLDREKNELARTMTLEMGKLFRASVEEIEKCERGCRYYAENAERFLEDEVAQTDARRSYVHYEPMGPILAIMPWNFPFWQVFRFAAPALMAGNVGLLKHAANVPQCALAIEQLFCRAGVDEGVFQTLLIESDQVERLIVDPRIKAVTLTGSEKAGSAVGSAAAREIKKSVLELGGSDPFIVMPSADFGLAVSTAVKARMINTGQSCIAAKRFFIADKIYDDFLNKFVEQVRTFLGGIVNSGSITSNFTGISVSDVRTFLALLWQILSGVGFPNQFFNDSWVVGFWRGRPWLAGRWIGKRSLDVGSSRFWIGWVIKRGGKCARSTYRG